jgi:hypothetical protein
VPADKIERKIRGAEKATYTDEDDEEDKNGRRRKTTAGS